MMVFPGLTLACDFNLDLSKIVYNPSPLKYQVVIVPYSAMNLQISEKKRKKEKVVGCASGNGHNHTKSSARGTIMS